MRADERVDDRAPRRYAGRAGLDRPGLDRPGLDRAGLDRAGSDRAELDRAGSDRAGGDSGRPGPRRETARIAEEAARGSGPGARTTRTARVGATPAGREPVSPPAVHRRTSRSAASRRSLGGALLASAASAIVPGTGLLMIRRTRAGALVLGVFLLVILSMVIIGLTVRRSELLSTLLSSRVLLVAMLGMVVAGLAWVGQVVRTWVLARPRSLAAGPRAAGIAVVTALCLAVATPFGYAANLVNSQRSLLDTLFAGGGGGTSAAEAINKPRLNVLLVGSDAGPDRTGTRTDTMMVASIDTRTARTTLFALPRNIGYAQFPPGSALAKEFPRGFHDPNGNSLSGDYLLNAVYAYALDHPTLAPPGPTKDIGLNALHETVGYMMGIDLDYYVEVNMAGFASIIDAVGGVTVDVGPTPLPIGGVLPNGRHVKPEGYVPAGVQHLGGDQALWFARSRRDSDDYNRMGRQRCLLQSVLAQKSPTDVITHFQDLAAATTNSVSTNMPQEVLGQLVGLVGEHTPELASVSFDPNLPDPNEKDGKFNTSRVDVNYMRKVVQDSFTATPVAPAPTTAPAPTPTGRPKAPAAAGDGTQTPAQSATPESLAASCG